MLRPMPANRPAYEREPYSTQMDAVVLRVGTEDGRVFAVLDDTLFYPEGGGQPADRGFLGEVAVVDVQKRAGEVFVLTLVSHTRAARLIEMELVAAPAKFPTCT